MTEFDVTVCGPLNGGGFDLHRTGCRDLQQAKYRGYRPTPWTMTVHSFAEVVSDVYQDQIRDAEYEDGVSADWNDYADEFRVAPCLKDLP